MPFPYKFLSYFIIIGDGEWHALRVREQPTGGQAQTHECIHRQVQENKSNSVDASVCALTASMPL
jgi:hypothetical protein